MQPAWSECSAGHVCSDLFCAAPKNAVQQADQAPFTILVWLQVCPCCKLHGKAYVVYMQLIACPALITVVHFGIVRIGALSNVCVSCAGCAEKSLSMPLYSHRSLPAL